HGTPSSMHLRTIASIWTCSRRMRPNAVPKITTVPAMLPRIGCSLYHSGRAARNPTLGATDASIAIQYQLNPFTFFSRGASPPGPLLQARCARSLLAGMVRALGVPLELIGIEEHLAEVAGRIALGLIGEVLRRGGAALAARGHGARVDRIRSELDDRDEAV